MNVANATAILRAFSENRAERTSNARSWSWSEDVILFPEAICAWCGSAMLSNRIWLVNERTKKLVGQIALVGGKVVKEPPTHPHVSSTGYVCLSSCTTVSQALFVGMSMAHSILQHSHPSSWQSKWKAWMVKMFDHDCKATGRAGELSRKLSVEMAKVEKAEVVEPPLFGTGIRVE